ncbi:MAG TPA: hypothetical protein VNT81_14715 [Vicinamibacterales bacterium]|nr:hypothetical protein [Vicinamibacterales bacterium]
MSNRIRVAAFWIFVAACVGSAIAYVRWRTGAAERATGISVPLYDIADPAVGAMIDGMRAKPVLFFQSASAYGRIGAVDLDNLAEQKIMDTLECERSHFGKTDGLCLVLNRESIQPRAFAYFLDRRFQPSGRLDLAGLPIRARVSADAKHAASTVFVTGESYASEDFTTRTTIYDLQARKAIVDLEQFTVERNGQPFSNVDFNYWGVTFRRDSNRFLATLGTGGKRFLVEGDIAQRRFRVIADDVECPSLSPDERHVVFKRQRSKATGWQLWAMNMETRESWPITEDQQDIDDQVEWLDNEHVLYGMVLGSGLPEEVLGLWSSRVDKAAGKNREFFLRSAWSPAVVR